MNFFGLPFFIPYQFYLDTLNSVFGNFSQYTVFISSNMVIPLYIFVNFIYWWFFFRVVFPLIYKIICYVLNFFDR